MRKLALVSAAGAGIENEVKEWDGSSDILFNFGYLNQKNNLLIYPCPCQGMFAHVGTIIMYNPNSVTSVTSARYRINGATRESEHFVQPIVYKFTHLSRYSDAMVALLGRVLLSTEGTYGGYNPAPN